MSIYFLTKKTNPPKNHPKPQLSQFVATQKQTVFQLADLTNSYAGTILKEAWEEMEKNSENLKRQSTWIMHTVNYLESP